MKDNILLDKSFAFAIRKVNAYQYLIEEKKEFVISKHFLGSGSSIPLTPKKPSADDPEQTLFQK